MSKKTKDNLSEKYQKKSHREHILQLPDTYIGSVEHSECMSWTFNENDTKLISENMVIIPGLYKIFDEILVNAYDQYVRKYQLWSLNKCNTDDLVRTIKVSINKELGEISVYNDGEGIDIDLHPEHNIYIPELIFGNLLTSTNYDKDEEKITGGKNGYGAKLTNIFSKKFTIETTDFERKKKFIQSYYNNMIDKDEPLITDYNGSSYTKITFIPDFERFGISNLSDSMYSIMKKRVYDIAACTDQTVSVYFNDIKSPFKNFEKYSELFLEPEQIKIYEKVNERWEIVVAVSTTDKFEHYSFVNGICTSKGGKHVDYISNNLSKKLAELILKKKKLNVKPNYIKENLVIFIKCTIVNPSFDSQTKDYLTTSPNNFGSKCEFSDKLIEKISKCGIIEKSIELFQFKENKKLKTDDGKKTNTLRGIPKLDDANFAGGVKSNECTLILTEGDSAKSMAVAGISVIPNGRNLFGIFPLRGKVLNVKDKINTIKGKEQIFNNEELKSLKKILGLQTEKKYINVSDLRYGKVMIMTDQDVDGSHIKGLLFNVFHTMWPELMKIENSFLTSMMTPIIKVIKNKEKLSFYNLSDYDTWKKNTNNGKGWNIKYYKGLGTSTSIEAKEYFTELKVVDYKWNDQTNHSLDLAFDKSKADERKVWLQNYDKNIVIDIDNNYVNYEDFVNKELIHFSNYDLSRSIPNLCDGLKTSQRKILYGCFKRNLRTEVKVAQLSGYISENASYHHGEMSLHGTMIGMAQDFVGSNNINVLYPGGQFGTRIQGGKDSASPRYIHTRLEPITDSIYNKDDFETLNYLDDDGFLVEPEYYMPIIPMILVNGTQGVGTGFSTFIPCYNPIDICNYLIYKINHKETFQLHPWYNNFKGTIEKISENSYITKGKYNIINYKSIEIVELPIGTWTENYKEFLEELCDETNVKKKKNTELNKDKTKNKEEVKESKVKVSFIKDYINNSTESQISFIIEFKNNILNEFIKKDLIEKELKLTTKISTTNMHLFNKNCQIEKYNNVEKIIDDFYDIRLVFYQKRKDFIIHKLEEIIKVLNEKVRFINDVINENIIINKRSKDNINQQLEEKQYIKIDNEYKYLVSMPIYNLSLEKKLELEAEANKKNEEYQDVIKKTITDMWLEELHIFKKKYSELQLKKEKESQINNTSTTKKTKIIKKKVVKNKE